VDHFKPLKNLNHQKIWPLTLIERVMPHFVLARLLPSPNRWIQNMKKSKTSATPASDLDGERDATLCVGEAVAQASQLSRVHVLVQLVLKNNKCKN
jgi:hypothetical protein